MFKTQRLLRSSWWKGIVELFKDIMDEIFERLYKAPLRVVIRGRVDHCNNKIHSQSTSTPKCRRRPAQVLGTCKQTPFSKIDG